MSADLELLLQSAPASRRNDMISTAIEKTRLPKHYVRSETGYLALPVITVGNPALSYRADNGRILLEVATYAKAHGRTVDDVKANADDADIQRALHDLLIEKARDARGPIFAELEAHGRQTEPLLISSDGIVVNGNRRLASMRVLLDRDPVRYTAFAEITAAVLPDTITTEAIEFIEAALQMAPDLKLSYSWINRRLKLREHAQDLPREKITEAYRFDDASEIDRELAELQLAETYLRFIGAPRSYDLIEDAEKDFLRLNEHLPVVNDMKLRKLWRYLGFAMIASRDVLDRPIAHYFPFAKPMPAVLPNWVLRRLAEDAGLTARQVKGEIRAIDRRLADRLQLTLSNPRQAEHLARAAMALIDTLMADERHLLGASRMLKKLRQVRKTLENLHRSELDAQQLRQIHAEITAVKDISEALSSGHRWRFGRRLVYRFRRLLSGNR